MSVTLRSWAIVPLLRTVSVPPLSTWDVDRMTENSVNSAVIDSPATSPPPLRNASPIPTMLKIAANAASANTISVHESRDMRYRDMSLVMESKRWSMSSSVACSGSGSGRDSVVLISSRLNESPSSR